MRCKCCQDNGFFNVKEKKVDTVDNQTHAKTN